VQSGPPGVLVIRNCCSGARLPVVIELAVRRPSALNSTICAAPGALSRAVSLQSAGMTSGQLVSTRPASAGVLMRWQSSMIADLRTEALDTSAVALAAAAVMMRMMGLRMQLCRTS